MIRRRRVAGEGRRNTSASNREAGQGGFSREVPILEGLHHPTPNEDRREFQRLDGRQSQ